VAQHKLVLCTTTLGPEPILAFVQQALLPLQLLCLLDLLLLLRLAVHGVLLVHRDWW
jgi:hypothetical protein